MKNKTLGIRLAVLLVILAIAAVMFVIGRGHTVYFDNKTATHEDTEYTAFYRVNVFVNGEQVAKNLGKRDRGMATCIGQHFSMELEIIRNKGEEAVRTEYSFALPYDWDGIIVNLPEIVAGLPPEVYQSQFIPTAPVNDEEEVVPGDDLGLPVDDF